MNRLRILKRLTPRSVKTTLRSVPIVRNWRERQSLLQRYDGIVSSVYDPQLQEPTDHLDVAEIEINRNCNINCVMCNTSLSTRPQFNMDLALRELLLHQPRGIKSLQAIRLGARRTIIEQLGCSEDARTLRRILHDVFGRDSRPQSIRYPDARLDSMLPARAA